MSGGHYDQRHHSLWGVSEQILAEVSKRPVAERPARRAFAALLKRIGDAIHQLDYIDSGDTAWPDCPALLALVTPQQRVDAAHQAACDAVAEFQMALAVWKHP